MSVRLWIASLHNLVGGSKLENSQSFFSVVFTSEVASLHSQDEMDIIISDVMISDIMDIMDISWISD